MIGLVSGIRFVLGKVVTAVDGELHDEDHLREELMNAQMRHELGEIGDAELAALEDDLMPRLRAIAEQKRGAAPDLTGMRVTGADAVFTADEEHGD
jgi:hypothetical protein